MDSEERKSLGKIVCITLTFFLSYIYFVHVPYSGGSKQVGVVFWFLYVPFFFLAILIIIASRKQIKSEISSVYIFLVIAVVSIIGGFGSGAIIATFCYPVLLYVVLFAKVPFEKFHKPFLIFLAILYTAYLPISFFYGTDIYRKVEDPCFKRTAFAKGESWFTKDNRVCAIIDRSHLDYYFETVDDADVATFEGLGGYYAKDKNRVYYNYKSITADVETFVYDGDGKGHDKNGTWEDGERIENN